ncbi:MAG: DUF2911 domain-containing protein [Thermoflexibacter sp.]|jgi:hypothetical protein|nr:DUF2911 domain-containing protein [Thermoflexibacter sp.]
MKKILIIITSIIVIVLAGGYGFRLYTKSHSPEVDADFDKNGLKVHVDYCQPSKKGREIFGGLEPYGEVWRTGANEATEIEFSKDVTIAGSALKAGRYALFSIPNQDKWTIIFNNELGMWGAFNYKKENDVLRVDVPVVPRTDVLEKFTISFQEAESGADMSLEWDKTKVIVPIR